MEMSETQIHILVNALMSACGFVVCYNIIPKFKTMFINAHLFGIDMSKRDKRKMWVLACAMLWTKQIAFVAFVTLRYLFYLPFFFHWCLSFKSGISRDDLWSHFPCDYVFVHPCTILQTHLDRQLRKVVPTSWGL